jgi:VWFA-related protein
VSSDSHPKAYSKFIRRAVEGVFVILFCALPLFAANRLSVTVIDAKSGRPVTDLKAEDFTVFEDKLPRKVEAAEYTSDIVDVMFLLDTSLAGPTVRPVAEDLIAQLKPKEQMAIVSFHSSADLIQDFTSSKELLARAVSAVTYGNEPRVLDGLYAAIDTGMKNATFRRVVLLLTTGYEGDSRMTDRDVARLARKSGVSIYPVYATGRERSLFEHLARRTGGAVFNLQQMRKSSRAEIGARIFEVIRGHYTLTVPGNLALGEKLRIEIARPGKWFTSALPLEWE